MGDVNDFFNMSSSFERVVVPAGYVNGRTVPKLEANKFVKREFQGTEYGEAYRKAELEEMKKVTCFTNSKKQRRVYQSNVLLSSYLIHFNVSFNMVSNNVTYLKLKCSMTFHK